MPQPHAERGSESRAPLPAPPTPTPRAGPPAPEGEPEPWETALVEQIRRSRAPGADPAAGRRAWAELLTSQQDRIYAICVRMVRDPELARDLTQEAFVKVIQGIDSFDSRARLSTWMIRIAMNVCLSHLRKARLRRHASLDAPMGSDEDGPGGEGLPQRREPGVGGRVQDAEARRTILAAMDGVDPEHRAVLVLRDVRGLDYREIAEALDVPVGTVKSRLFRARAALRDAIEQMGGIEGWGSRAERQNEHDEGQGA